LLFPSFIDLVEDAYSPQPTIIGFVIVFGEREVLGSYAWRERSMPFACVKRDRELGNSCFCEGNVNMIALASPEGICVDTGRSTCKKECRK
jgi:hypothetical protein